MSKKMTPAKAIDPEVIRALRESMGLTQQGLASLLDVSWSTVSRWEHDNRTPNIRSRKVLQQLFDKFMGENFDE